MRELQAGACAGGDLGDSSPCFGQVHFSFPGLLWAGELLLAAPAMAILKPASLSKPVVQFSVIFVRDFGFHRYLVGKACPCLCEAEWKSGIVGT